MGTMNIICLFLLALFISCTQQFNLETCRSPLGIETGKILDSAFSSSSSTGSHSSASKARIRSETNGWCPLHKISNITYEYIQINLVNLTVITLIELQGKFSQQPNEEFADSFRLEYRRETNRPWIKYKDFSGHPILNGNINSHIPTIRNILPSIIAKEIRIIPIVTGPQAKHICMRLELYGCSYSDGPISYSIPQGDKRGYDIEFIDEIYDGYIENGTLKDGLGQLTDGILAGDDYRSSENVQGIGPMGYDWIGWKRRSSLELIFHFSMMKNFTSIHIHTSNLFTRDIYIFNSIIVTNCKNDFQTSFLLIPEDLQNIQARFINISLAFGRGIISNCLKLTLTFNNRSKWILISEVLFQSKPIISHFPILSSITKNISSSPTLIDTGINLIQYWYWLLLASGLLIILILLLIFIYIQWMKTFQQRRKLRRMTAHLKFDSSYQPISIPFPVKSRIGCCYLTTNSSSTSDGNSTCSTSNNGMRRHLIISTATSPSAGRTTSTSDFGTLSTASPTTMSTVYQSTPNPYLTAVTNDIPNVTSNPYASIDMYTNPLPLAEKTNKLECTITNIQGPCGNSTLASISTNNDYAGITNIARINDEQLIFEEHYSTLNGTFGTIVRGYIYLRHPYDILKPILIKILITNDPLQKELFEKEHELLSRLNHPNIVRFFGCTHKQNYALIEHSNLEDVHTFLSNIPTHAHDQISLSLNIRLFLVTQLSNALRYLESENIVHRDIAARNCLLFPNYEMKLTHTAMGSKEFPHHYFTIDHCRLPIRWMAPETIANNEFTIQSDVWSFGITLWEIMTNCSSLPYALINDEQVYQRLKLMGNQLVRTPGNLQLSKPECLSKEIVDLMLECWRPLGERPTFHEIFTFFNKRLNGINLG